MDEATRERFSPQLGGQAAPFRIHFAPKEELAQGGGLGESPRTPQAAAQTPTEPPDQPRPQPHRAVTHFYKLLGTTGKKKKKGKRKKPPHHGARQEVRPARPRPSAAATLAPGPRFPFIVLRDKEEGKKKKKTEIKETRRAAALLQRRPRLAHRARPGRFGPTAAGLPRPAGPRPSRP